MERKVGKLNFAGVKEKYGGIVMMIWENLGQCIGDDDDEELLYYWSVHCTTLKERAGMQEKMQ